jgi:DNA-binding HxlR family transcriptional regulator
MDVDGNEPSCSIERSLEVLGERWTLLILRNAFRGTTRFADFRTSLGIAPNLLSTRLRTLVAAGILEPRQYREPGSRSRVSYHLTDSGSRLRTVLAALQQWGDEHRPRPDGPSLVRRSRTSGRPVRVALVDDDTGKEIPLEDLVMLPAAARAEPQAG